MSGSPSVEVTNMTWISPATSAPSAGPAPLYGTCTMCVPARALNSALTRWIVLPTPGDPYDTRLSGLRATAMSSLTVWAENDGFTARMGPSGGQMGGAG